MQVGCWRYFEVVLAGGTPALRNLVKGVTRYIFGYLHEGKGEIFWAIVSHFGYAICYNRSIE